MASPRKRKLRKLQMAAALEPATPAPVAKPVVEKKVAEKKPVVKKVVKKEPVVEKVVEEAPVEEEEKTGLFGRKKKKK